MCNRHVSCIKFFTRIFCFLDTTSESSSNNNVIVSSTSDITSTRKLIPQFGKRGKAKILQPSSSQYINPLLSSNSQNSSGKKLVPVFSKKLSVKRPLEENTKRPTQNLKKNPTSKNQIADKNKQSHETKRRSLKSPLPKNSPVSARKMSTSLSKQSATAVITIPTLDRISSSSQSNEHLRNSVQSTKRAFNVQQKQPSASPYQAKNALNLALEILSQSTNQKSSSSHQVSCGQINEVTTFSQHQVFGLILREIYFNTWNYCQLSVLRCPLKVLKNFQKLKSYLVFTEEKRLSHK